MLMGCRSCLGAALQKLHSAGERDRAAMTEGSMAEREVFKETRALLTGDDGQPDAALPEGTKMRHRDSFHSKPKCYRAPQCRILRKISLDRSLTLAVWQWWSAYGMSAKAIWEA